jgi:hypothetical protein
MVSRAALNGKEDINDPQSGVIGCGLGQNFDTSRRLAGVVLIDEVPRIIAQGPDIVVLKGVQRNGSDAHLPAIRQSSREQELFHANLRR